MKHNISRSSLRLSLGVSLSSLAFAAACAGAASSSPCNAATCSPHGECVASLAGDPVCMCDEGYASLGTTCVPAGACDGVDCSGHGTCAVNDESEAVCTCDSGFTANGTECVSDDPCEAVDCSGRGTCSVTDGQPQCACDEGYVADELACVEDPCEGIDCSGHGTCSADGGQPQCACDLGYTANGTACEPAFDIVYEGEFTLNGEHLTTTDALDPLQGATLRFFVGFDVEREETDTTGFDELQRQYITNDATFVLEGDNLSPDAQALVDAIVADLHGQPHMIDVRTFDSTDTVDLRTLEGERDGDSYVFWLYSFEMDLDESGGYPVLEPFTGVTTGAELRRRIEGDSVEHDRLRGEAVVSSW